MTGLEPELKPVGEITPKRASFIRAPSIGRILGALIGLVLVVVFLGITEPTFLSWGNIMNIFRAQSITFILAIGMTFVILTGGLDLSVASATGFAGMVLGFCIKAGIPAVPAMLITVATVRPGLIIRPPDRHRRIPFSWSRWQRCLSTPASSWC